MANKTLFSTDVVKKTMSVERAFDAPLAQVWDAWTKSEILDQWWAPKPYRAETKRMDFKPGGHWLYAMVATDGTPHWCLVNFKEINRPDTISDTAYFCDEDGVVNIEMPPMNWWKTFTATADKTIVNCEISFSELAGMEKIIAMGFEGGFKMGLNNLEEYFNVHA